MPPLSFGDGLSNVRSTSLDCFGSVSDSNWYPSTLPRSCRHRYPVLPGLMCPDIPSPTSRPFRVASFSRAFTETSRRSSSRGDDSDSSGPFQKYLESRQGVGTGLHNEVVLSELHPVRGQIFYGIHEVHEYDPISWCPRNCSPRFLSRDLRLRASLVSESSVQPPSHSSGRPTPFDPASSRPSVVPRHTRCQDPTITPWT